eukprot:g77654.t1
MLQCNYFAIENRVCLPCSWLHPLRALNKIECLDGEVTSFQPELPGLLYRNIDHFHQTVGFLIFAPLVTMLVVETLARFHAQYIDIKKTQVPGEGVPTRIQIHYPRLYFPMGCILAGYVLDVEWRESSRLNDFLMLFLLEALLFICYGLPAGVFWWEGITIYVYEICNGLFYCATTIIYAIVWSWAPQTPLYQAAASWGLAGVFIMGLASLGLLLQDNYRRGRYGSRYGSLELMRSINVSTWARPKSDTTDTDATDWRNLVKKSLAEQKDLVKDDLNRTVIMGGFVPRTMFWLGLVVEVVAFAVKGPYWVAMLATVSSTCQTQTTPFFIASAVLATMALIALVMFLRFFVSKFMLMCYKKKTRVLPSSTELSSSGDSTKKGNAEMEIEKLAQYYEFWCVQGKKKKKGG